MAATVNKRAVFLGAMKLEKIWITSDGTNDDTAISSLLANVEAVSIAPANADQTGTADGVSVTFSGKALTLRDPSARDYVIEVLGF